MTSFPVSQTVSTKPPAWTAIYAMTLCVFVLIASEFMPISLLSPIAHDLRLTPGQAGQAISISGLFAFVTSLLVTSFIGDTDRRHVLLALTGLLIASGTLVAMAPTYAVLMIGRALLGIAIGGFWSLSAAITMALVPPESVPRALAVTNAGNALASIVAPPLGSLIGGVIGWRGAFFCVVPLALVALVWQFLALPGLPPVHKQRRGRLLSLLRHPPLLIGLIAIMVIFGGMFAVFTYLRPFLEQVTHVTLATLSGILLLIGVSGFIGTVLIGRMIGDRINLLLAALALILAMLAMGLAVFGGSVGITVCLLTLWGLVFTSSPVAWWTWLTRVAPDDPEAGGALIVAGVQMSIMLGATLGGVVFDAHGARVEYMASAAVLVVGALLAFVAKPPSDAAN